MPAETNTILAANIVTIAICLAGLVLLWFWQVAPSASGLRSTVRVWHINVAWVYFIGMAAFVFLSGILSHAFFAQICRWFYKDMALDNEYPSMLATGVMHLGFIAGALYAYRFIKIVQDAAITRKKPPYVPEPPIRRGLVVPVGIGVFCIVICVLTVFSLAWTPLLEHFGIEADEQELVKVFRAEDSATRLAVMSFIAIVIAPISEELVFRAGLFGYLRTRLPRALAIIGPALIFALVHLPFKIAAFPLLFLLGVILSIAYERTGRIAVPMIAHALLNLNTIATIVLGLRI